MPRCPYVESSASQANLVGRELSFGNTHSKKRWRCKNQVCKWCPGCSFENVSRESADSADSADNTFIKALVKASSGVIKNQGSSAHQQPLAAHNTNDVCQPESRQLLCWKTLHGRSWKTIMCCNIIYYMLVWYPHWPNNVDFKRQHCTFDIFRPSPELASRSSRFSHAPSRLL